MEKTKILVIFATLTFLASIIIIPVNAAKPTVNNTVYFGALATKDKTDGVITWSGDGSVIHNKGAISIFAMFYKTPTTAPVQIGHIDMETNFEFVITGTVKQGSGALAFDTYVGEGNAQSKWTITVGENSIGEPTAVGPFGKGTLEGTTVSKVTSTFSKTYLIPGNGTGLLVATHGTGYFENAKLMSNFVQYPFYVAAAGDLHGWTERITVGFDGTILPPGTQFPTSGVGDGKLTFHE